MEYRYKIHYASSILLVIALGSLALALFTQSWFYLAVYVSIAFTYGPISVIHYQGSTWEKEKAASEDTAERGRVGTTD